MRLNRISVFSSGPRHFADKPTSPAVKHARIDVENCRICPFWEIHYVCCLKEEPLVNGSYPAFRSSYSHEELVEHFLLTDGTLLLPWRFIVPA
jgi:hypothetical protein